MKSLLPLQQMIEIAAFNVAILIILIKWNIVSLYQLYRPKFLPNKCNFCWFFWCSIGELIYVITSQAIIEKHLVYSTIMMVFDGLIMSVLSCTIFSLISHESFRDK